MWRLRELAFQSVSATHFDTDRAALDQSVQRGLRENHRIGSQASSGGYSIEAALTWASNLRSTAGAIQARFESTITNPGSAR